jgi:hypothetical protein
MALVFVDPANPANRGSYSAEEGRIELSALRCVICKETKPLHTFPKSCATYRRGSCTECNTERSRVLGRNPLERKLTSARVRYGSRGRMRAADVAVLYEQEGIDWRDPANLSRTCLVRENPASPLARQTLRYDGASRQKTTS